MRTPIVLSLLVLLLATPGCMTRNVVDTVVDTSLLQIRLRSQKKGFGPTIPRGFDQPVEISALRMRAILEDIEIDTSRDDRAVVRERKKAISTQIIRRLSERLAEAYAKAGPDDEVVVVSLRKQMQHGVFNRKYMTSFVTYVEDGELYVFLSRVEFKLAEDGRAKLPADPRVGDDVMRFRTVGNANYTTVGARGVKVDWRSPAFGTDLDPPTESQAPEPAETGADAPAPAVATPPVDPASPPRGP